jgi:hypothetical protein
MQNTFRVVRRSLEPDHLRRRAQKSYGELEHTESCHSEVVCSTSLRSLRSAYSSIAALVAEPLAVATPRKLLTSGLRSQRGHQNHPCPQDRGVSHCPFGEISGWTNVGKVEVNEVSTVRWQRFSRQDCLTRLLCLGSTGRLLEYCVDFAFCESCVEAHFDQLRANTPKGIAFQ